MLCIFYICYVNGQNKWNTQISIAPIRIFLHYIFPGIWFVWILYMLHMVCIFDIFPPTDLVRPLYDGFDPSLTSDDPNWSWKILNLNSWDNSESKHMYIGYISTNSPDLTLIWRFDPSLTSNDLWQVMIYIDSKWVIKTFPIF